MQNLAEKINLYSTAEINEDTNEKLKSCLRQHVVDINPYWEGRKEMKKSVSDSMVALIDTQINRCDPPLSIPKIVLQKGKSIALAGQNGSGKSTIFDGIMRTNNADFTNGLRGYNKGAHEKENLRIARLNQEELLAEIQDLNVAEIINLVSEYYKQEFPIDWEDIDAFDKNIANQDAQIRIDELMNKVAELFEINIFRDRKINELSGGEKTKLSLLMLLSSEPDVLLLDEPTNHLDLESISKLIGLFNKYKKAGVSIVNVSHVEWFLDAAGQDGTIEIECDRSKRVAAYSNSPYKKYKKKKPTEQIIDSEIAWNEYGIEQAKSAYNVGEEISIPDSPLQNVSLPLIQIGDLAVFSGKNGTGKTKMMEEIAKKGSRIVEKEKGTQVAYLPQFWPKKIAEGTVQNFFDWIKGNINPNSDKMSSRFVKELRNVGFPVKDKSILGKKLSSFSGGEQRLLWFIAASIFEGTDVLVLDEPSNHMDSKTMDKILNAIRKFKGAVILSSHDLRLMNELDKDPGSLRAGRGITNMIFSRNFEGNASINVSEKSPAKYAEEVMEKSIKKGMRL